MRKWLVLLVIALLGVGLLFLVGCDGKDSDADGSDAVDSSTSAAGDGSDLIGVIWKLTKMADASGAAASAVADDIVATLEFAADGMYFAQAPVNTVRGPYTFGAPDRLTLAEGAMTQMAGIDDAHNVAETTFVGLLSKVVSYKVQGDTLSLLDDAGAVILEFTK